jgi:thiamine-monophosphate kinase
MGCYPTFAVVAIMIPRNAREAWIKRLLTGLERTARKFDTAVVGGDVASHAGKLAINVALLGETRDLQPVRRSGARLGDAIAVTGPLGGSILGKHLRFTPRVREGIELNRRFEIHSMIDLSDGLATDLGHLCEESRVGAVVDETKIPITPQARRLPGLALDHALFDGEDYELLFTLPPTEAIRLEKAKRGRVIGHISAIDGVYLQSREGKLREVQRRGWEHRFKS